MTLRIVFAGTPTFACQALEAIYMAGFEIPLVLSQPDRPAGRGMQLVSSPVAQFARTHALPLLQPPSLRRDGAYSAQANAAIDALQATPHDVMVVAAYGLILPQVVLDIPKYGCLNIHASLLPRWRGAAPIQRALEAGDTITGITLMKMDAGLDTGPILSAHPLSILPEYTSGQLHERLAELGAQCIVTTLQTLAHDGHLTTTPQCQEGVCYAEKIRKEEGRLDFSQPAAHLAQRIRAFNPAPGCTICVRGHTIKVWQADVFKNSPTKIPTQHIDGHTPIGTVLQADKDGIVIACGVDLLRLTELQKAGGKRLPAQQFIQSFPFLAGERLELLPPTPIP